MPTLTFQSSVVMLITPLFMKNISFLQCVPYHFYISVKTVLLDTMYLVHEQKLSDKSLEWLINHPVKHFHENSKFWLKMTKAAGK